MTTDELDKAVHDFIISNGGYPTPLGFMHFPKSVCTSVNEVLCHGIPDLRPLEKGDYINIDVTCFIEGYHGDTSVMALIGDVHPEIRRLIDATQRAVYESIKICKPGVPFNKIGDICERVARDEGFTVCPLFNGHGIGKLLHLPPSIIPVKNKYPGVMEPGNAFTIEPIFMMFNSEKYHMWDDHFTTISRDNPSAQWEHTVLITETGCEVITLREGEKLPII
eukprot:TRINITY_DN2897_c0_g3_i4.p1 TRINITY_DN2897_c0_g3~~TRINITY_DN2897_c0_g3_i4.p1  ORF type:complete len:222 (-),score=41.83 TRINITY_DN2897_c0_g3_i4:165-830(-)